MLNAKYTNKVLTIVFLLLSSTTALAKLDAYFPLKHPHTHCEFVENFKGISPTEYKNLAYQLAVIGDCEYSKSNYTLASKYWGLSSINNSPYGKEVFARMTFVNAHSAAEVNSALTIFRSLEEDRQFVYFQFLGISYLGNSFQERNVELALVNFKRAISLGGYESSALLIVRQLS